MSASQTATAAPRPAPISESEWFSRQGFPPLDADSAARTAVLFRKCSEAGVVPQPLQTGGAHHSGAGPLGASPRIGIILPATATRPQTPILCLFAYRTNRPIPGSKEAQVTSAEASMVLTHIDAQRVYDFDDACAHLDEAIAAGARPIDLPPVPRGTILSAPVTPPTIITLLASLLEEQRAGSTLLRQVLAQLQWNAGAPQPGDTDEEFN